MVLHGHAVKASGSLHGRLHYFCARVRARASLGYSLSLAAGWTWAWALGLGWRHPWVLRPCPAGL